MDNLPNFDDLARVAAAHCVEVACSYVSHPEAVLDLARYHYARLRGENEMWPERSILH